MSVVASSVVCMVEDDGVGGAGGVGTATWPDAVEGSVLECVVAAYLATPRQTGEAGSLVRRASDGELLRLVGVYEEDLVEGDRVEPGADTERGADSDAEPGTELDREPGTELDREPGTEPDRAPSTDSPAAGALINDRHADNGSATPTSAPELAASTLEPQAEDPPTPSAFGVTSRTAVRIERLRPGSALAIELESAHVSEVDEATLVEMIAAWERMASWALERQARAVMELADRRGTSSAAGASTAAEVAARLGITPAAGEVKLGFAAAMSLYPEVADALGAGRIDRRKAEVLSTTEPGLTVSEQRRVLTDLLAPPPPPAGAEPTGNPRTTAAAEGEEATPGNDAAPEDATSGAEEDDGAAAGDDSRAGPGPTDPAGWVGDPDVLPVPVALTVPQLRARLRKAAVTAGADAGAKRRAKAFADRHIFVEPAGDAMAWVSALIRADHAEATRVCLDALAAAAKGPAGADTRTLDQRRADVFTDVFTTLLNRGVDLTGAELPTFHGTKPHIQVTIPAGTLLGLTDAPAVLGGYGPIPADLARAIAADGTWRGLFTDATGCFKALGSTRYRPGADLSRQVIARDVTCTFPGCRQPAWKADLDHIASYDPAVAEQIEQTTKIRLQALCRRHHNLKTTTFWSATRDETTGAIRWTAPTGHTYTRAPPTPPTPDPPAPLDDDPPPY